MFRPLIRRVPPSIWAGLIALLLLLPTGSTLAQTQPESVTIAGTIQLLLGCDDNWQPPCEATFLTFDEETGLWSGTFELPAGSYEYKVAINGSWEINFGRDLQPGSDFPGKQKCPGHTHRTDGIELIGIEEHFGLDGCRPPLPPEAMGADTMNDVFSLRRG